jgi:hypothetical protein
LKEIEYSKNPKIDSPYCADCRIVAGCHKTLITEPERNFLLYLYRKQYIQYYKWSWGENLGATGIL